MAGQTTTSVVQVTVTDSGGYSKSFNLEYPKQNLTLNQIKAAFQPAIDGGWWLGSKGDPIVAVSKATYSTSTKIEIAAGEVSVTPASWALNRIPTQVFTVENATPTALNVVNSNVVPDSGSTTWQWYALNIDGQTVSVSGTAFNLTSGSMHYSGTATLQIWFGSSKVDVPITVDVTVEA